MINDGVRRWRGDKARENAGVEDREDTRGRRLRKKILHAVINAALKGVAKKETCSRQHK